MKHSDRGANLTYWHRVARGALDDPDVREWLVDVAGRVVQADGLDPRDDPDGKLRQAAIVEAVGLKGRRQSKATTAALRETVRHLESLPAAVLTGRADATEADKRHALRVIVCMLHDIDPAELATKAGRERVDARIRTAR